MKQEMLPAEKDQTEIQAPTSPGFAAALVREKSEVEGILIVARNHRRKEDVAYAALMKSCKTKAFAKGAVYSFPRGGGTVSGPSVQLAREQARVYENIRYGFRFADDNESEREIRGFAHDMETNLFVETSARFQKLIQRKNKKTKRTEWVKPDERDLRELTNKHAAICIRNAILQVVPPWWTTEAIEQCAKTMGKAAKGDLEEDRKKTIRGLLAGFAEVDVTREMLEQHLEIDLADITQEQLQDMRQIYQGIKDGVSKRGDFFDLSGKAPATSKGKIKMEDLKAGEKDELDAPEAKAALDKSQEENEQREREPGEDNNE